VSYLDAVVLFSRNAPVPVQIYLGENLCIDARIGCETCQITQSDLKEKLQACFNNCNLGHKLS
jgi:hypothetical protein